MHLADIRARISAIAAHPRAHAAGRWARRLFQAAVLGYIAVQLSRIGWAKVAASFPATPWFYLLFLVMYITLPLAESLIYQRLWKVPFGEALSAMVRKRVYNKDVLGYSGEVFLYVWARKRVPLPEGTLLGMVKDNAIISSVASTVFTILLMAGLLLAGMIRLPDSVLAHEALYIGGVTVAGVVLVLLGSRFHRTIFHLLPRQLLFLFVVHLARMAVTNLAQFMQWAVAQPSISWSVWGTYLALLTVISRIPSVPGLDLVFVGLSVQLSQFMDVQREAIAGVMLVQWALDKSLNLTAFAVTSRMMRKGQIAKVPEPEPEVMVAANPLPDTAGHSV